MHSEKSFGTQPVSPAGFRTTSALVCGSFSVVVGGSSSGPVQAHTGPVQPGSTSEIKGFPPKVAQSPETHDEAIVRRHIFTNTLLRCLREAETHTSSAVPSVGAEGEQRCVYTRANANTELNGVEALCSIFTHVNVAAILRGVPVWSTMSQESTAYIQYNSSP